jgi:hypothetical protein
MSPALRAGLVYTTRRSPVTPQGGIASLTSLSGEGLCGSRTDLRRKVRRRLYLARGLSFLSPAAAPRG